ncbi:MULTISPECIES: hypothetical protein [Chryseobacterium]|uniref:hypothetical protein n=1 Tax=Chryseobacterium TaxID=59732 RepID=UPI00129808EE|nr:MULTISPECIES: hypothetical protein [Chryseobacterium]MDR6920961.1 hypothetical protein [Chryseobacterium sp. 2987]
MRYLCFLWLLLSIGCKKQKMLGDKDQYLVGKWKIMNQPFDFFPFDYRDEQCALDKNAAVEINDNGTLVFSSTQCEFSEDYRIRDFWLEIQHNKKTIAYGITKVSDRKIILFGNHFPSYILKHKRIPEEQILRYDKEGFQIVLEKSDD